MPDTLSYNNPIDPNMNVPTSPNIDATQVPNAQSPAGMAGRPAPNIPLQQPTQVQVPPTPAMPQRPPTPLEQHANVYQKILGMMSGGMNRPQRDAQGNPVQNPDGTVRMAPASAKHLGMSILAASIASMAAGYATPSKFNEVAPGRFQQDFSGSAAAGVQAATPFGQEGSKTIAQQQADNMKARQLSTLDHNMKLHAAYLSNLKMQGDLLDAGTDEDEPLIKALATAPPIQDPNDPTKTIQPIIAQGVPEDKLLGMMKGGDVTRQSILRDGKIPSVDKDGNPILNDDGTPHMQWTYTVYDQKAMVPMSNEIDRKSVV